jgi:hypothetical protein
MRQGFASSTPLTSWGRGLLKRLALLGSLAVLSLAASAAPAGAAVTIGQLAPGSAAALCTVQDRDFIQPSVTSGNTYVVPPLPPASALVVTSWTHNSSGNLGQQLSMKVFRHVTGATWSVVGHDGPRALVSGGTSGNTFSTSIAVKPGDVLGVNSVNANTANNACAFGVSGEEFLAGPSPGGLADGDSGSFSTFPNARLNITAVVAPSNAFSLGAITRNKKKGTATLTANVPNPGELTGSGKGVKVASAAVITKTVTPGAVKLTIKAKGKKKTTLNETGKVKVNPKITYTPTGGTAATQSRKVKLNKKL